MHKVLQYKYSVYLYTYPFYNNGFYLSSFSSETIYYPRSSNQMHDENAQNIWRGVGEAYSTLEKVASVTRLKFLGNFGQQFFFMVSRKDL